MQGIKGEKYAIPCYAMLAIDHSRPPSSTTSSIVRNSIRSYSSLAAVRAWRCQGPVPPWRASSRLRQRPVPISIMPTW